MIRHSYGKPDWRQRTLDCLSSLPELWVGAGRTRKYKGIYAELFGDSGECMYELLKPYLAHDSEGLATKQYIAMEFDPSVVARAIFRSSSKGVIARKLPFRLTFGDAYQDVPILLSKEEKLTAVMLDTTNGINVAWWRKHEGVLRDIVFRATKMVPTFVLGLNHTLSRGSEPEMSVLDRARLHADSLCGTFREWNLRRTDLLPEGSEDLFRNLNELLPSPLLKGKTAEEQYAPVGGFDIYRSANKVLNMITVRIVFESRRRSARVWCPTARARG
jgi:hypothetical protein